MRTKVELYERIRRDHAQHKWGVRRLAKEHHCHRREVRQALTSALPPSRTFLIALEAIPSLIPGVCGAR